MGVALRSDLQPKPIPPSVKEPEALELSVVMPCLNEAETLETCIRKALRALREANIAGEVVVADNGSTDGSIEIAERLGARVVRVTAKGYGHALMGGIAAAAGKYILMGDADDSYDFGHAPRFVEQLRQGADLVMGNRFRGGIQKAAMPALHRYLGNSGLTRLGRCATRPPVSLHHARDRSARRSTLDDQRPGNFRLCGRPVSEPAFLATARTAEIAVKPATA